MSKFFYHVEKGPNANEAFFIAYKNALAEHKNELGFSGTIAEKDSFIMIEGPSEYDYEYSIKKAQEYLQYGRETEVHDPLGPAGCIHVGNDEFLFFGAAYANDSNED